MKPREILQKPDYLKFTFMKRDFKTEFLIFIFINIVFSFIVKMSKVAVAYLRAVGHRVFLSPTGGAVETRLCFFLLVF